VLVGLAEVADHAVAAAAVRVRLLAAALPDHAEAVDVVQVQQGVVRARQAGERRQVGRVAGHAVDPVHADQPRALGVAEQQPLKRLGVVVGEAHQAGVVGAGDHAAVPDGHVGAAVDEEVPSAARMGMTAAWMWVRGAVASGPRTSPPSGKVESASYPEGRDNHPKRLILSIVGDVPDPSGDVEGSDRQMQQCLLEWWMITLSQTTATTGAAG